MTQTLLRTLRHAFALHVRSAHRSFITLPRTEPQRITAIRTLPYNSNSLYTLIADIDSYSAFLPYCTESKVTKWSSQDKDGQCWPSEADLKVGWGGLQETFTSRVLCLPGSVVEALGGDAVTSLPKGKLSHHDNILKAPAHANSIFKSLSTRWTVKPLHLQAPIRDAHAGQTGKSVKDHTEVHLSITFQFSNPIHAALSQAVVPKIAGTMIEAFEVRARNILENA